MLLAFAVGCDPVAIDEADPTVAQSTAPAEVAATDWILQSGRKKASRGPPTRALNDLTDLVEATKRIADQTRQRVAGVTPQEPPVESAFRSRRAADG